MPSGSGWRWPAGMDGARTGPKTGTKIGWIVGERVLILSVGAGSGHNRAAQALEAVCRSHPEVEQVEWVDCLQYANWAFRDLYSRRFLWLVRKVPFVWAWAFDKTDVPWQQRQLRELLERLNTRALVQKIQRLGPTACVCTHFTPAAIVSRMLGQGVLSAHLSVVVTDFYVHGSWLTQPVCRYFVSHEENRVQLEAAGVPADRIDVTGIPIDPAFEQLPERGAIRRSEGLAEDQPVVVLCPGSAGATHPERIVDFLEGIETPCQFVIVCGRNNKLRARLRRATRRRAERHAVRIMGYTDRMQEWMAAADLFIGKPGGLTTAECLACGLPMIVWDPVPGQEIYNAGYLVEQGAGLVPNCDQTLPWKVDGLLRDRDRLAEMQRAARAAGRADAARRIVQTLLNRRDEPQVRPGFSKAPFRSPCPGDGV